MGTRMLSGVGAALVVFVAACSVSSSERGHARIALNLERQHQVMRGWEATAQAGQQEPGAEHFVPQALDAAAQLGITRLRLEILSGAEHPRDFWMERRQERISEDEYKCRRYATVNDNNDPLAVRSDGFHFSELDHTVTTVVLPFKQRLERRGVPLHLNVNYVAFTKQICDGQTYHHDDPEEYAEFVLATLLHLRDKFELVADTWEVILEPDNTRSWSGRRIGEAIVAAGRRLRANGFATKFVAPSCTHMGKSIEYFDALSRVPGAVEQLSEISYHRYGGVSEHNLRTLASRSAARGVGTAMLEKIGASFRELHQDLKIANASSWQQFTLAYPERDNGAQYFTVSRTAGASQVRPGARTRYFSQYFVHVRPGARRVDASSDSPLFDPLAFKNVDGAVVVIIKADRPGTFEVHGLPAGHYETSYTTETTSSGAVNGRVIRSTERYDTSIPAAGVLTIAPAPEASDVSRRSDHD